MQSFIDNLTVIVIYTREVLCLYHKHCEGRATRTIFGKWSSRRTGDNNSTSQKHYQQGYKPQNSAWLRERNNYTFPGPTTVPCTPVYFLYNSVVQRGNNEGVKVYNPVGPDDFPHRHKRPTSTDNDKYRQQI